MVGIERETPYDLSVGYLKGAEQTDARLMFNVMPKFGTASKHPFCIILIELFALEANMIAPDREFCFD